MFVAFFVSFELVFVLRANYEYGNFLGDIRNYITPNIRRQIRRFPSWNCERPRKDNYFAI